MVTEILPTGDSFFGIGKLLGPYSVVNAMQFLSVILAPVEQKWL